MQAWLICVSLLWASAASAHEFWLLPDRFSPAVNQPVALEMSVGERFIGEPVAFGQPVVAALRLYSQTGQQDLQSLVPQGANERSVAVAFAEPGAHLLALDSRPYTIDLAAGKFTEYLREEGLERVIEQRAKAGQSSAPGRERYRRHIKTLLHVAGQADATTFATRTGQALELVPLAAPQAWAAGRALPLQVWFKGAPLAGALVKAWHRQGAQLTLVQARTNAMGRVSPALPHGGVWMLSVVHMVPVAEPGIDWDSHWGNFTLELPVRPALARSVR